MMPAPAPERRCHKCHRPASQTAVLLPVSRAGRKVFECRNRRNCKAFRQARRA